MRCSKRMLGFGHGKRFESGILILHVQLNWHIYNASYKPRRSWAANSLNPRHFAQNSNANAMKTLKDMKMRPRVEIGSAIFVVFVLFEGCQRAPGEHGSSKRKPLLVSGPCRLAPSRPSVLEYLLAWQSQRGCSTRKSKRLINPIRTL